MEARQEFRGALVINCCACGCGNQVGVGKTWYLGHDARMFWTVARARGWDTETLIELLRALPPKTNA